MPNTGLPMPDSNWRAALCDACRNGVEFYTDEPGYHLAQHFEQGPIRCTAPSPDTHIAALTARIADLEAGNGWHQAGVYQRKMMEAHSERDELRSRLQQSEAALVVMRTALKGIRDAKARWIQGVGSYAGGETFAGFAQQLQGMASAALSTEAIAAEAKRRKATDAVVEAARKVNVKRLGILSSAFACDLDDLANAMCELDAKDCLRGN